jgi:23S rRNA (adenine1618-N6)-methyltransferase
MKMIEVRLQKNKDLIFTDVVKLNEHFHLSMCNPPFHASLEDAKHGSDRKNKNLGLKKNNLNFAGLGHELWCNGGEVEFIKKMIAESVKFKNQILWFTTLVSKKENVDILLRELKNKDVVATKVIDMNQGQKISRIIAWTYTPIDQHKTWNK